MSYDLTFDGYWRDRNVASVDSVRGIYVVYACTVNRANEQVTLTLHNIVYIGQAQDTKDRLDNHEKKPQWQWQLGQGQELAYSVAQVDGRSLDRVEAALINHHKPPCNSDFVTAFPFDKTTIQVTGKASLLTPSFTVDPSR